MGSKRIGIGLDEKEEMRELISGTRTGKYSFPGSSQRRGSGGRPPGSFI
jgi:hypothetical protein